MKKSDLIQEIIERLVRCQRPASPVDWQKFGLSHAQVGMLFMLSFHRDASVNQIAGYLGVSKSAVTQLVEPLVDKHMVARSQDPKDRRVARLCLSAKGKKTVREIGKLKSAGLRSALASLDTQELEHLALLLAKMTQKKG